MPAWWSDDKINATVQRDYVWREIGSKRHQEQLHRPLSFGQGLTDDTYLDWILQKGKRLFLVLNHIGIPEWIFQVLDKSLDDDDLPLSEDALWDLNLFGGKSETLDKKFYKQQFKFVVRDLDPGDHVDYQDEEIVPLEPITKRTNVPGSQSNSDKVSANGRFYTRMKVSTSGDHGIDRIHFGMHVKALRAIRHAHVVSLWASYTQADFSYMLFTPYTETSLKSFLDDPPKNFKQLEKAQRHATILKWTHCLTSALAYLHSRGLAHQSIRPSSISISDDRTICLFDFAAQRALNHGDSSNPYKAEIYDHAAPENWQRKACLHETAPLKTLLPGGGRTMRRIPTAPAVTSRSNSNASSRDHHRNRSMTESSSSSGHSRGRSALITTFAPPSLIGNPSFPADVFSLTTILVHLLSLLLGHSPKASAAYRGRHNRFAGRGGAPADASFHKNLPQVAAWMDDLQHEAKEKERVFRTAKAQGKAESAFWGSVIGAIEVCRDGLRKEVADRSDAKQLEKRTRIWVDRGLGAGRRWCCGGETEEVIPGMSFASVAGAEVARPEPKSESRDKSLRSVSMAYWEDQSPIERPTSLADTLPVEGPSVISGKDEKSITDDFRNYNFYIPEEQEDDWPIRMDVKPLTARPKPLLPELGRRARGK